MWDALLSFGKFLSIALFGSLIILVVPAVIAIPAMIGRYAITHVSEERFLWTIDTVRLAIFAVVVIFVGRTLLKLLEDYI